MTIIVGVNVKFFIICMKMAKVGLARVNGEGYVVMGVISGTVHPKGYGTASIKKMGNSR